MSDSSKINKIENIIESVTDKKPNLSDGFNIVLLENNTQKPYITKGDDQFKGDYYIIKNGTILTTGYGSSKASITPGYKTPQGDKSDKNKGNNLLPGTYTIKGDLKNEKIEIYENETKMLHGDRILPSTKGTQDYLLIHAALKGNEWSGGIGCQVLQGFKSFCDNYVKNNTDTSVNGNYYLIDMKK